MLKDATDGWSITDSAEYYEVPNWGKGYFSIGEGGQLMVHPEKDPHRAIDLKELVDRLQLRGVDSPILFRFNGILRNRLEDIHNAFAAAIKEHNYKGAYSCVYPIKVNQQRHVVESVLEYGRQYGFGLEAGSKPELLAVVALTDAETPIICNGFKDAEFIEMALTAQKLGRRVIPVVEKYTELENILSCAERLGVRPEIGMRAKLAVRGSGRWQGSGGARSKFGLTFSEVLRALERLREAGMEDCFKLLHFHLGSQITNIRHVKAAISEATRAYADLIKRGAGLQLIDVGGGLGVDYDGSQTNFASSMNYTLQEYANDVVYHIQAICDEAEVPHPHIISESGRAVVAYNSLLVFDVLGVSGLGEGKSKFDVPEDAEQCLRDLAYALETVTVRNVLESFHDAQQALETALTLFGTGYLSLEQRCLADNLYWAVCRKIRRLCEQMDYVPEELDGLDMLLSDTYFCNFSLFQSMPDSWAIGQLFPIMPIHRLKEKPTQEAVLGDITCDSDGKVDKFIDRRDVRRTLRLHALDGEPYYIGAFLVGAYQEILGDMHNLFGDTNAVHVDLNEAGEVMLTTMIKGDSVREVLQYVQYHDKDLLARLQTAVETAVQQSRISHGEAGRIVKFYEQALHGYTYLEDGKEE